MEEETKKDTLKEFYNKGGILLSIKCLDEGVDIPAADHALILASSSNKREYIQRRGRVLRVDKNNIFNKLKNKELGWNDLCYSGTLDESLIEYIDSYEQNNAMISMRSKDLHKNSNYIYLYYFLFQFHLAF
mgnify:CR=1 FL=1